jgi:hypothetical protein
MKKHIESGRGLPGALIALLLFCAAGNLSAVTLQGNPFTPPGADFQIVALQGVDASNPFGISGVSPQVNTDFEMQPSIGVSYQDSDGKLKDFGLGLFQDKQKNTFSTGLNIQYNKPVDAFSVSVTVMDFDIEAGKDAFFKSGKVAPGLILLGANNSIFASLSPTDIFPYLSQHGNSKDVWDIKFADLLNGLHIADGSITGFVLYADKTNGEKADSDPYLLLAIGNGIPAVPEPATYFAGLAAIGFALLFHVKNVLKRKRAVAR